VIPRRLTVLHLVANRWWTGSAEPVLRLVLALRAQGHRVLLGLAGGDRFETKAREGGVEPVEGLRLDVKSGPLAIAADARRLRALVSREKVDVVHTHHSHDHWLGWWSRGGAALVRSFHNERAVRSRWPDTSLYRRSDALVSVSRRIAERLLAAGAPRGRVHRVDGVVDVARFASDMAGAAKIREEFSVGDGPLIGCVSRLAAGRGHESLIEAFQQLLVKRPEARLLLVGKGERRDALIGLVARLGLGRQVLFAGYRDADLPAVLAALDIFVLLGSGSDESCRAALEAMAAGRPVLAARVGALPDAVVHGETGLLLGRPNPEEVAAGLERLLASPGERRAMGEAGRRRALALFTPEHHAATTEAVYLEALSGRAQRP
jgi:glycosyltransferase involved in cell wall biosynthesis